MFASAFVTSFEVPRSGSALDSDPTHVAVRLVAGAGETDKAGGDGSRNTNTKTVVHVCNRKNAD